MLLLISRLPDSGLETVTYEGVTYTQDADETCERFRGRLAHGRSHGKTRFIWVSELDARL